ncbi:ribonuclease P [Amylolactobacillus amylotrophicus DSM 20534]|uniref:Ribonuclease P protein component n=3 Tax=Amylolactobacillus TaxID=2767876 RepID=A0A1L6XBZ8_9LACO|nr:MULTISPECIES: ribonuclease P protein component [Amylolactobacillus]APT18505.1 ribonuclease P protein component [Amylolactobacillus amylophilus DSM 20533 = JCM 1125]KRK37566.1 ribonuclease P [Amylolactobacillus amylotrophicus DSM 20534]KRM43542.1 ribonuclease P [Amylolactobacillus amylophilus DSM 20533 = JCM 1125]
MKKSYRVKSELDFQKVFDQKNSVANRGFVIYQLKKPGQAHFRVGISVGKKVGHTAVLRNRLKRYIRATLTEVIDEIPAELDFLVIARASIRDYDMKQVRQNLLHVLKLAKILPEENKEENISEKDSH